LASPIAPAPQSYDKVMGEDKILGALNEFGD